MTDLFSLEIEDFRELCRVADTLQERCFTCIRSAHDKNPKTMNSIEVLSDVCRIHVKDTFCRVMRDIMGRIRAKYSFDRYSARHMDFRISVILGFSRTRGWHNLHRIHAKYSFSA